MQGGRLAYIGAVDSAESQDKIDCSRGNLGGRWTGEGHGVAVGQGDDGESISQQGQESSQSLNWAAHCSLK